MCHGPSIGIYCSGDDTVEGKTEMQPAVWTKLTTHRQRLLFRVLHAMSLYLPDTGYVQGMAALAATLLCYYEEDRAFVMLVRLWMLRGLERLYEAGFAGLMEALDDFEQNWLCGGDVAKKLVSCHCVLD